MAGAAFLAINRTTYLVHRNPQTYTSSIHAYRCRVVTAQLRSNRPKGQVPRLSPHVVHRRALNATSVLYVEIGEVPHLPHGEFLHPKNDK